jgi:hypothetical protein
MERNTKEFFDQEAGNYRALSDKQLRAYQEATEIIAQCVAGHTVCIGGLWPGANPATVPTDLTIVDLSPKMMELWAGYDAQFIIADARALPIGSRTVDTIVYPLVLHHICDGTITSTRQRIRKVFREARRVLVAGGQPLILDFHIAHWLYMTELTLSGVTRRLLAPKHIPMVIMHTARFYKSALAEAGFTAMNIAVHDKFHPFDLVQPVIGLPWLTVPRFTVPWSPLLLIARPSGTSFLESAQLPDSQGFSESRRGRY